MGISQDEAAAIVGLTSRRLRQLESEGGAIPRRADGTYEPAEVGKWFRSRILEEAGVAQDGQAYDYNAERGRLTKAQADKTELEVAELRAELVRLPIVVAHWEGMVASMRARLLALPSRLAAKVAGPDRLQQTQDQAQALVYEALSEIANDAIPHEIRGRAARECERAGTQDRKPAAEADDQPVGGGKPVSQRGGQRRARKV